MKGEEAGEEGDGQTQENKRGQMDERKMEKWEGGSTHASNDYLPGER